MRITKAPYAVTNTVPVLKGNSICNDVKDCVKGGILRGTKYAWLCEGSCFKVIDVSSGEKIAGWRFQATDSDYRTEVTCAVELPLNDDVSNFKQIILGLECEIIGGLICIYDIQGSRILRAIRIPGKPLSLTIVDNGNSGCEGRYPLPGILSSMCGIIAVGLLGGSVYLIDLRRLDCEELLNTWFNDNREEVRDETNPCQLVHISKEDDEFDKLEKKCASAAVSGDHVCLILNENAFLQDNFLLLEPEGEVCGCFKSRNVGVTSLLYVPQIASLVVGYSFSCFQIWNLMNLTLNFTSRMMKDPLPVLHLGFQEPSDDPCNFCYLWAVNSSSDEFPSSSSPVGMMYALSYDSKEWIDGYGYLYEDYQSCRFRFEYNLEEDAYEDVDTIRCITCSTLTNVVNQKSMPEDGYDEVVSENDFSLCIFSWEAYDSENKPLSTYLSIFDLNQWYKDQMPLRISNTEDDNLGYMVTFSLNEIRQREDVALQNKSPLLDIRVDQQSLSQFKSFQPQEEHFHPSALSFASYCLLEDKVVSLSHPGLQRFLLLNMEKEGPLCLLRPVTLFKHCVMVGLKPVLTDINGSNDVSAVAQREFLLSVALENQMLGFLHRCASDWANGSVSGVDCSLPLLLNWGIQRALLLKETADGLCVHLFDHTGIRLDKNECRLLDNCATQLRQLATLFDGILGDSRLLTLLNLEDVKQKAVGLNLFALYYEVLQWFLNVGLLPEFPENELDLEPTDCNTSVDKIPYPATILTKFYDDRRQEFKSLNLRNGTKACLYVDQLLQNEDNGSELVQLWQNDGGSGLYSPPSIQSLLAMYLLDGIDVQTKNSIVIYVFLDLATLLDPERYRRTIEYFVKFPCAFCMTPSIIKVTQAFWLLDQKHFEDALDMLLDPLVSPKDLQPWQHRFVVHALLSQGQHNKALEYFTVRQLPIQGIEDIQLKITLLVMNKQVTQAYNFLQLYLNEENSKDLLHHFYRECGNARQLGTVLKLMLSPTEEELLMNFLQNSNISQSEDMQVVFYLMRSRVIEAVSINEKINFGNRKTNFRFHGNDPALRDVLVGGYAKTLPSVTRQLANYCSQQKRLLSTWRQVQRPTPMSVEVNYGNKQPVSYKSSLIHATLEKARETWMIPMNSSFRSEERTTEMDVTAMQNLPFLCTSHDAYKHGREASAVVFPLHSAKRRFTDDDEAHVYSPSKRTRLESSPSVENFFPSSNKHSVYSNSAASSLLLKSPLVKRVTPARKTNGLLTPEGSGSRKFAGNFTPQSILKVRNLIRSSISPESPKEGADNLISRKRGDKSCSKQIRFSLPPRCVFEEPLVSSTPASLHNKSKAVNDAVESSVRLPIRSSLSLLQKTPGESLNKLSPKYSLKSNLLKNRAGSPTIVQTKNSFSLKKTDVVDDTSVNSDETMFREKENSKSNDSQGEDFFYSASSSSASGTSIDETIHTDDNLDSSYEKYIQDIKRIKPRRHLTRLNLGSGNNSGYERRELLERPDNEQIDSAIPQVDIGKQQGREGSVDVANSMLNDEVKQYSFSSEDDDGQCDESILGNTFISIHQKSIIDQEESKVTETYTFVEREGTKTEKSLSNIRNSGNFVETVESDIESSRNDKSDNDQSCVSNSVLCGKSVLGDTFLELNESMLPVRESDGIECFNEDSFTSLKEKSHDIRNEVSEESSVTKIQQIRGRQPLLRVRKSDIVDGNEKLRSVPCETEESAILPITIQRDNVRSDSEKEILETQPKDEMPATSQEPLTNERLSDTSYVSHQSKDLNEKSYSIPEHSSDRRGENVLVCGIAQEMFICETRNELGKTKETSDELVSPCQKTFVELTTVSTEPFEVQSTLSYKTVVDESIMGPDYATAPVKAKGSADCFNIINESQELFRNDERISKVDYVDLSQCDENIQCVNIGNLSEQASSSTAGDTSGTIELDSDDSEENILGTEQKYKQECNEIEEIYYDNKNKSKIHSYSENNLCDLNKQSSVSHSAEETSEIFVINQNEDLKGGLNPENMDWNHEENEPPLDLKLSDSENEEEAAGVDASSRLPSINVFFENQKCMSEDQSKPFGNSSQMVSHRETLPNTIVGNDVNCSEVFSQTQNAVNSEVADDQTVCFPPVKVVSSNSVTTLHLTENPIVVEPEIEDPCQDNESLNQYSLRSDKRKELKSGLSESILINNISQKYLVSDQNCGSSSENVNQSRMLLLHENSPKTELNPPSLVHVEPTPSRASVTGNDHMDYSKAELSGYKLKFTKRKSSLQNELEMGKVSTIENNVIELDVEDTISSPILPSRGRKLRQKPIIEVGISTEKASECKEDIFTQKPRQRKKPSSVQSETPRMSDVIVDMTSDNGVETSNHRNLRRRRSSLQFEPSCVEVEYASKESTAVLKDISTQENKKNGQSRSLQGEPPNWADVSSAKENMDKSLNNLRTQCSLQKGNLLEDKSLTNNAESINSLQTKVADQFESVSRESMILNENSEIEDVERDYGSSQLHKSESLLSTSEKESQKNRRSRRSSVDSGLHTAQKVNDVEISVDVDNSSAQSKFSELRKMSQIKKKTGKSVKETKFVGKTSLEKGTEVFVGKGDGSSQESVVGPARNLRSRKLSDASSDDLNSPIKGSETSLENCKMSLRSYRSYSVDREFPNVCNKGSTGHQHLSDSDNCSVQSEPPTLSDIAPTKLSQSTKSRKGSLKKKKSRSAYVLKIPPPKLPCLKEEPENVASLGEGEDKLLEEMENEISLPSSSGGNLRNRKHYSSKNKHNDAGDDDDGEDSPTSLSSKSTLIIDHSVKRKRESSPSSPEQPEVKKYFKNAKEKNLEDDEVSNEGDNSKDAVENYATARRLTRYQKTLMERSLEIAKGVRHGYRRRYRQIEDNVEDSDKESEASGCTSGSSQHHSEAFLRKRQIMREKSSLSSKTSDGNQPSKRLTRHRTPTAESPTKPGGNSPSSVCSGRSAGYASSISSSQWPSPASTCSHSPSRPRRKSFQKAQEALHSPFAKRDASSKTSNVGTSADDTIERVSERKQSQKKDDSSSESGSEKSRSSAVSSRTSRSTRSSVRLIEFASPQKSKQEISSHQGRLLREKGSRLTKETSDSFSSAEDSPQMKSSKKGTNTSEGKGNSAARESQNAISTSESNKYCSVLRSRKYFVLSSKRRSTISKE